jgi:hypothetical protein
MTASTSAPLLSIVLTAQQVAADDFDSRVLAPLRFNHEQLSAHGISHEFILVLGEAWMAALDVTASGLGETLSVLEVDSRYADAFRANGSDSVDLVTRNAGIRRARGMFILATACGVCIGRRVLRRIADRTLERGILYRAPRVDIGIGGTPGALAWESLEQPRSVIGRARVLQPPMYAGDAADFILLDRESFHQLRGFNEIYGADGCNADGFVVKAYANGHPIQNLGAPVYHIRWRSPFVSNAQERDDLAGDVTQRSWGAARTFRNPDTWGLSAAVERRLGPQLVWLEFDWSAVPALVDLDRVVSTAAQLRGTGASSATTEGLRGFD